MRLTSLSIISLVFLICSCQPKTNQPDDAVTALIRRVVRDVPGSFKIEYIPSDNGVDVFELESNEGYIILRGNNGVSIASALHFYLKNYCHREISWNNMSVELGSKLPIVDTKVRRVSPYRHRYYLNYCTFNYTMAWWDWEQWQREIDWMALNGINMPLALTGEEAIWRDVYRDMGFSDEELADFFTGPAYFSWLWMGNIDKWGGPLPQHWMDSHKELQKKILERERALGMLSVLPAFTGHVPPSFGKKFPEAKLRKTNWDAGFDDVYILDPQDPMFEKIGAKFLETQTQEYGTDHYYSADTFNENVPPTNDSTFISDITAKIFKSMTSTDPKAVWVMQGWMFHYNDEYWKSEQIQALTSAVPDDAMIILDLYSESHPVWKQTNAYYGKPWIWNMLQNFGGNVSMFGRMKNVASDPSAALKDPASGKMIGIGLTPEGSHQNPALFSLMLENVWQDNPIDVEQWLPEYVRRRYGSTDQRAIDAWRLLEKTVYSGGLTEGGAESILVARPTLESQGHRVLTKLNYDPLELAKAWELLASASDSLHDNKEFQYDLVDVTRQVLANYALTVQQEMAASYVKKDILMFDKHSKVFLGLFDDMDTLLRTEQDFLLGTWIDDARRWGLTEEEKDLYELNARDLVTLWGDKDSELHEYSNRQWAGLMSAFYKPRWEQFIVYLTECMKQNKKPDTSYFERDIKEWEWNWVNSTNGNFQATPSGDPVGITRDLFLKYNKQLKTE
jgi:alpha-N-acetylglucosaminidase